MKVKIYNIDYIIDIIFPQLEKEDKKVKKEFKNNHTIQIFWKSLSLQNPKEKYLKLKIILLKIKWKNYFRC